MAHNTWFISRVKRQLTLLPDVLIAFNDVVIGNVWAGNTELQIRFEDELGHRGLIQHGNLRSRAEGSGGGGARTYFAWLKSLGLVFVETEHRTCQLTLAGLELLRGDQTFVDIMRHQLIRFQYPSNSSYQGSARIDERFNIHPFWFLLKLMCDERIQYLSVDEIKKIIIIEAVNDSTECFEYIVNRILLYREQGDAMLGYETSDYGDNHNGFYNISNTFINYLQLTQYIERSYMEMRIKDTHLDTVRQLVQTAPAIIPNHHLHENFQRRYGCDNTHARDLRQFNNGVAPNAREVQEMRIRQEYVSEAIRRPITHITPELANRISVRTGIDSVTIETFLQRHFPNGNLSSFLVNYREMAFMGNTGTNATDFELATVELFREIFGFHAEHVGPQGNTPDVYIESADHNFCAIIDNKAYREYSITGDHKRRMLDVYIPTYSRKPYPLAYFAYIAGGFSRNINGQVREIQEASHVNGCAITADYIVELAEKYEASGYNHDTIKNIFSVNRQVTLADL